MAEQGGADTRMAGLEAVLDREDTAGTTAAPPRSGRSKCSMYPVQRSVRYITGDAALLDDETAGQLRVVSGTPPGGRRATHT